MPNPYRRTDHYTVAQAARYLGRTEHSIKLLADNYQIDDLGPDPADRRRRLVGADDINRIYEDQLEPVRDLTVATIGTTDLVDSALAATGARVVPSAHILDAVSAFDRASRPVIVASRDYLYSDEPIVDAMEFKVDLIAVDNDSTLREIVVEVWRSLRRKKLLMPRW